MRKVMWLAAAAMLWGASPGGALAQAGDEQAANDTAYTMEVEVGMEGYAHPDEPLPIVINLTSEELIVGRVDVTAGGSTVRTDIEVPAGGAKQYVVYGAAPGDRRQVTVSLVRVVDGDDAVLLRETARLVPPSQELLVGLLGVDGLATALRSSASTPLETDVVPLDVSGASLSRGGGPLSYLVVSPDEVAELDDDTVSSLIAWLRSGGRIIGTPGALDRFASLGTGDVLDRAPAAVTRLGEGELIAVADPGELEVDEWSAILRNVPPLGLIRTETGFVAGADSLVAAATAGREASVPALPWLLGGIALFIVLVGPVNFLLLRRIAKPEWAWATVPLLSIVFVAGFWFIGRSSVKAFTVTSASVVVDDGLRAEGATALVMQIERGGTHELRLPDEWEPGPSASGIGVETGIGRVEDDGSVIYEFDLENLGVGAAEASWDAEAIAVQLAVTANGRQIEVTATNATGRDFWAWGIVVDGVASASADPLPAGETGAVSVRSFGVTSYTYEPVISAAVQRRLFYVDEFDSSDFNVIAGLAGRAQRDLPALSRDGIYFFGFTDDAVDGISVDGTGGETIGTTLMLRRSEMDAATLVGLGEALPEILGTVGASNLEQFGDGRVWAYGAEEVAFGYVVPDGVTGKLAVDPGSSQFNEVAAFDWRSGEFTQIDWGDDLSSYVSAGGEVVLRARAGQNGFFDEGILLSRYSIQWETGG